MKVLEKLNRLNGWQRIFCAFIAFIYLPMAIYAISEKKYIDRLTDEQVVKIMSTKLLTEIANKKAVFYDKNKPWFYPDVYLNEDKFEVIDYDLGYEWKYRLVVDKSVGEPTAKEMVEEFSKALGNEYSKKSFWARLEQFFFFLLGATAIYLFGWTLGWIKKGFKENKN